LAFFVLASKYQFLWFTPACHISNQIQREFYSNGGIAPFDHEPSASTNKLLQTIKLPSPNGEGLGVRFAPPKGAWG
jgi:hypothetical protein